jgi:hypothetical protein
MPHLDRLVRGHKNPFPKEDVLTAGMYCFQYPTLGFKTVSEQYSTLWWKTSGHPMGPVAREVIPGECEELRAGNGCGGTEAQVLLTPMDWPIIPALFLSLGRPR